MPIATLEYASTISSNFSGAPSKLNADDNNYAGATSVGLACVFTLGNLPSDAYSINSIRVYIIDSLCDNPPERSVSAVWRVLIQDSSATYYSEDTTVYGKQDDYTQTTRTTSDGGSTAWTVSQINDLRISLTALSATPNIGNGMFMDYFYVKVDYDLEPDVPLITSGLLKISGGLIKF